MKSISLAIVAGAAVLCAATQLSSMELLEGRKPIASDRYELMICLTEIETDAKTILGPELLNVYRRRAASKYNMIYDINTGSGQKTILKDKFDIISRDLINKIENNGDFQHLIASAYRNCVDEIADIAWEKRNGYWD